MNFPLNLTLHSQGIDMMLSQLIIDRDRYQLLEFGHIDIGSSSSILYSPRIYTVNDTMRIFTIFPISIWLIIFFSFLIMVIINSIKSNSLMNISIALDYYAIFWMKSELNSQIFTTNILILSFLKTKVSIYQRIIGSVYYRFG